MEGNFIVLCTDYGRPMTPLIIKYRTFGLVQVNSGAFGVFSAELSAPILLLWVPCLCYQSTIISTKNTVILPDWTLKNGAPPILHGTGHFNLNVFVRSDFVSWIFLSYFDTLSLHIQISNFLGGIGIWIWATKNYEFSHRVFVVQDVE